MQVKHYCVLFESPGQRTWRATDHCDYLPAGFEAIGIVGEPYASEDSAVQTCFDINSQILRNYGRYPSYWMAARRDDGLPDGLLRVEFDGRTLSPYSLPVVPTAEELVRDHHVGERRNRGRMLLGRLRDAESHIRYLLHAVEHAAAHDPDLEAVFCSSRLWRFGIDRHCVQAEIDSLYQIANALASGELPAATNVETTRATQREWLLR